MRKAWLGPVLGPLALAFVTFTMAGCPPRPDTSEDGGGTADMKKLDGGTDGAVATCNPDPINKPDAFIAPTGQKINPGDIGTACTMDAACKQGKTPSCWKSNLFNNSMYLPVPGGYCSSKCDTDADCGTDHICVNFGTDGKHCLQGCGDGVTCRKPGFVCTYLGADQMGNVLAGCFPDSLWDCNPKEDSCTTLDGNPGGCYRQAVEDTKSGYCLSSCNVGDPCDPDKFQEETQCLYIDLTQEGDGYRGTLCFPNTAMPKDPGATCQFSNECTDGYQCDNRRTGGSRKCEKLCNTKGKTPKCSAGQTCTKVFGGCEAGLCKTQ